MIHDSDIARAVGEAKEALAACHSAGPQDELDPWPPAAPLKNSLAKLRETVKTAVAGSISIPAVRGTFVLAEIFINRCAESGEDFREHLAKIRPSEVHHSERILSDRARLIFESGNFYGASPTAGEVMTLIKMCNEYVDHSAFASSKLMDLSQLVQCSVYPTIPQKASEAVAAKEFATGSRAFCRAITGDHGARDWARHDAFGAVSCRAITPATLFTRMVICGISMTMRRVPKSDRLDFVTAEDENIALGKSSVPFSQIPQYDHRDHSDKH